MTERPISERGLLQAQRTMMTIPARMRGVLLKGHGGFEQLEDIATIFPCRYMDPARS
mgnify:CR=1 FL=1